MKLSPARAALIVAVSGAFLASCDQLVGAEDGGPQSIQDLRVDGSTASSVTLVWTAVSDGEGNPANYAVAYGTPEVDWTLAPQNVVVVDGAEVGTSITPTIGGLSPLTTYEFQVSSFRGELNPSTTFSTLSAVVSGSTLAGVDPATVTDLEVVGATSSSVTLRWTQVDDGAGNPANYVIGYATPDLVWSDALNSLVEVSGSEVGEAGSYTIGGLDANTVYEFQIAAFSGERTTGEAFGAPSAVVQTTTGSPASSEPFFADNFDSGTKTNANGFSWGAIEAVSVSSARSVSGDYSLAFTFGPDAPGEDSYSEQRFNMGRYLSEYWVEYMLFVPSNFVHRGDSPNNNKFFMTWRDTYSDVSGGTWRIGYEYQGTSSTLRPMSSRWDFNSWESSGLNHPQQGAPFIGGAGPIQLGQWSQVRMQFKAASNRSASDGIMRMWINGTLFAELTTGRFHNAYDTPPDASLRNGYFLGWSNSGFAAQTIFYIDDVKFYDGNPGW